MKASQLKLIIFIVSFFYGIYIIRVIDNEQDLIKVKLHKQFFKRAIHEYVMLTFLLLLIGYAFINEKNINMRRSYIALISLALASAVTSFSSYVKLLTLPAFTVIFFWALTHSFI